MVLGRYLYNLAVNVVLQNLKIRRVPDSRSNVETNRFIPQLSAHAISVLCKRYVKLCTRFSIYWDILKSLRFEQLLSGFFERFRISFRKKN